MENQEMDQFLENRQNYMMDNNSMQHINMNVASAGCDAEVEGIQADVVGGGVGGVAGEILGVKYDEHNEEHDVGDDNEWKYKEVQQSEKQQHLQSLKNFGLDDDGTYESNELAEKETTNNVAHVFGNGDGGFVFGGDHHQRQQQLQHHDLFNIGNGHNINGHENINTAEVFGTLVPTEFEEKLNMMDSELEGFKTEGDFSSTSNVTESVEGFVPQVDVKIETKAEHQEMADEEEPSSLATNTTNGTSSLSENVPPHAVAAPQSRAFDDLMANLENKENSDPLTPQRPSELDLDQAHSQLNPDAKEFIPSFGSNPSSPTSPFGTGIQQNEPMLSDAMETQMYFGQAPSAVPRHLIADDDFVAQSPRKGKDDNNMDAVLLPKESEFELEADKRPHELETENVDGFQQRDEVMTPDQAIQQLPLDDLVVQDKENCYPSDSTDFQPSQFMDHGPETCVDPDVDLDIQTSAFTASLQDEDDVMKKSIYVTSDDAIKDVLNSVQPIPSEIDSVNNSFMEESATESAANHLAGDKELLQVEEKEHVSQSPSTEEIQMNLQNTLNSSNKDIPQLPVDMDNANNMQESMYMLQDQQSEVHQQEVDEFQAEHLEHEQMFHVQELQPQVEEQQPQVDEQLLQEDLRHEQLQNYEKEHFRDEFQQEAQLHQEEKEEKKHQEIQNFPEEVQYEMQDDKQNHFQDVLHFENVTKEPQLEQELLEEPPLGTQHHDELFHDQPIQDNGLMADTESIQIYEENLLADTTNPLMANESTLGNSVVAQENQQEINELFSPFTDEISTAPVIDSFNFDAHENQQDANTSDALMTPSSTADEKHLLEETKEQELFSMSGLEQQMNNMMLNNTDGHLSQAEEVVATTATTAIEDISENLISPDENVTLDQYHQHQDHEQTDDQMMVDDSFQRHELECLQQHELEQQQHEEANKLELEFEQNQQPLAADTAVHYESIESPIEQQHKNEMVAVEEPIIASKQAAPLFAHEETEIVNVTKTEEIEEKQPEETQSMPISMVPETAPAELLLPPMGIQNETEINKKEVADVEEVEAHQHIVDVSAEAVKEPVLMEVLKSNDEETSKKEVVETTEVESKLPVEAAAVAAAAAVVAATAAVGAKTASSPSKTKSETTKKPLAKTSTTAAKPKAGSTPTAKKPVEVAKKPVGLAAKPRTAPAKPAAAIPDKKPIAKTTTTTTTTAARKPLSATTTTASKVLSKTSTTTLTTRTATAASRTTTTTRPTTAPRTVTSTTTARKPATTSTTTNGPLAKPRPATASAKPTTLGLSATNGAPKPKPTSPRSTLTSQVRKTTPATTAAKSPLKSSATNGAAKTATTTLASRTKTTTSTVTTTAGKTFTARPAPKFTSSSSTTTTTTTTRRLTVGGSTTAATTTTTTKTSSTPLRKSSPTKPATGKTPTKSTVGGLKSKAPAAKPASPLAKPAPIRKPVDKTAVINGDANANKELNGTAEEITVPAEEQQQQQASPQNGDLKAVQLEQLKNGDFGIPMQTAEQQQSLLQPGDEQMPVDIINA